MYYSFFQIGRDLAEKAKSTIPQMSDEYANFILGKYHDLGREWCKQNKKRYNGWHQQKAKEILFQELKNIFPKWETKLIVEQREDVPGVRLSPLSKLSNVKPLN